MHYLVAAGVFRPGDGPGANPLLLAVARWAGCASLLWYGTLALRRGVLDTEPGTRRTGYLKVRSLRAVMLSALAVTLLNPHVYLDTVLLIGSLGVQQTEPGAYVGGAASASLPVRFTLALGAAWLPPAGTPQYLANLLDLLVAVMMFAVALQLITAGSFIPKGSGTSISHSCCGYAVSLAS